jgi:plastocyanin
MRALISRITTLLIVAGGGAGCGGDSGPGTGPEPVPGTGVLTTLEVTPTTATLFTVAPGNTVALAVVAKDQAGKPMTGGTPTFSSDNSAIAGVSDAGTVTALAAGPAHITVSLTAGGITKTGTISVAAQVASATAGVSAPATSFQPATVDVQTNGTVSWTFGSVPHNVIFSSASAPLIIHEFQGGSASRTFPTNGVYTYRCSIHSGMTGIVRVH